MREEKHCVISSSRSQFCDAQKNSSSEAETITAAQQHTNVNTHIHTTKKFEDILNNIVNKTKITLPKPTANYKILLLEKIL